LYAKGKARSPWKDELQKGSSTGGKGRGSGEKAVLIKKKAQKELKQGRRRLKGKSTPKINTDIRERKSGKKT